MRLKYTVICSLLFIIIAGLLYSLDTGDGGIHTSLGTGGNKVCLVIVDGLRFDCVPGMPFLNSAASSQVGILYKTFAGIPTYSKPGYERIMTGTETAVNNIDSNRKYFPSFFPNLFSLARDNKLTTGISGFFWFRQLYPFIIDHSFYYYLHDREVYKNAVKIITRYSPDLMVIHLMLVDSAGHKYGGASSEYLRAACKADRDIENIWHLIKSMGYIMIITSDHGMLGEGGHGSDDIKCIEVPVVILSSDMKRLKLVSNFSIKKQVDIAPTICRLLGMPRSPYMTGESLVEVTH